MEKTGNLFFSFLYSILPSSKVRRISFFKKAPLGVNSELELEYLVNFPINPPSSLHSIDLVGGPICDSPIPYLLSEIGSSSLPSSDQDVTQLYKQLHSLNLDL